MDALTLSIAGDLERFTTEELYPLRYVITPLLVLAGLAVLYPAYHAGVHTWMRRHYVLSSAVGVPLLVVMVVAGDYFLSPLWERKFLEEESPLAAAPVSAAPPEATASPGSVAMPAITPTPAPAAPAPDPTPPAAPAFQPAVAYSGAFEGADDFHFGRGDALLIETEPGRYVLRFENFSVRNGPDLYVYLSEDPSGESIDEALNLGNLKATDGAFNYDVPPEIDVSRVKSAVVWCRQFGVLFAHAELAR